MKFFFAGIQLIWLVCVALWSLSCGRVRNWDRHISGVVEKFGTFEGGTRNTPFHCIQEAL